MANEEPVSAFAAYGVKQKKPTKSPNRGPTRSPYQAKILKNAINHSLSGNTVIKGKAGQHNKNWKQPKQKKLPQKQAKVPVVVTNGSSPHAKPESKKSKKRKQSSAEEVELPTKKDKKQKPNQSPVSTPKTLPIKLNQSTPKTSIRRPTKPTPAVKPTPAAINLSLGNSSLSSDPPTSDSIDEGKEVFRWLLTPVDFDNFFEQFWEKTPCLIQRNDPSYFAKLISCAAIDQMLLNNHVEFTKNIDVTSYTNGIRETLNPEGRAMPPVIWGHYEDGCSIRLLNPQTFIQSIYLMNSMLQEFFHCMVGTNAYLTPPNSQGFAPHYDDIEAFVLQIEGQKRWKLYNPRTSDEELPRFSSQNFSQDEIGEPVLDQVLKPGDVLYFPRGTIHQACTQPGYHSLHITLSLYQKHSYADLFEILVPKMLSRAIQQDVELRRGLPLDIWTNVGKIFTDEESQSQERDTIVEKCEKLMHRVLRHAELDDAVDQMAKRFQHDALPPALTSAEKLRTIFGAKTMVDRSGRVKYDFEITVDSHVRLLRANILRVVEEEDSVRIYYYVDNSKEYHEYEPNFLEIERESLPVVQQLIKEYPDYICTSELEADSDERKLSVVQGFYERGLLMVDEPMGRTV